MFAAVIVLIGTATIGAGANHIVVAGPVWYPTGPGTNEVNFIHTEIESTQCCAGSPEYDFGDNTVAVFYFSLNQDTPPGTYDGYLYSLPDRNFIETFDVEVQHAGAPPAEVGTVPNTLVTFAHTYPAPGQYTVTWRDCCLGSPQFPYGAPSQVPDPAYGPIDMIISTLHDAAFSDAQAELDVIWYGDVVPTFEGSVQAMSPMGVSGGTAEVFAR